MLADHLKARAINDYWLWFYTPTAMPLAAGLLPGGVVYDCMDELAAFRHAPRQLLQRENALFRQADLVFAGGQSLYGSKRHCHASVHCLLSSVDAAHFARGAGGPPHGAHDGVDTPRIGYFRVIDERFDLGIVDALADAHPEWSVVMTFFGHRARPLQQRFAREAARVGGNWWTWWPTSGPCRPSPRTNARTPGCARRSAWRPPRNAAAGSIWRRPACCTTCACGSWPAAC